MPSFKELSAGLQWLAEATPTQEDSVRLCPCPFCGAPPGEPCEKYVRKVFVILKKPHGCRLMLLNRVKEWVKRRPA